MRRARSAESVYCLDKAVKAKLRRIDYPRVEVPEEDLSDDPPPSFTAPIHTVLSVLSSDTFKSSCECEYVLDRAWELLKPALNLIFQGAPQKVIRCSEIYNAVKSVWLVDSGKASGPGTVKQLYDLIKKEIEPHVRAVIQSLENQSSDPYVFLPLVVEFWLGFKKKMQFVYDLVTCDNRRGQRLWDVCGELFLEALSSSPQVMDKVTTGMLALISDQRLGKTTSASNSNDTSDLLQTLMGMFRWQKSVFEKPFLDSTSKFYAAETKKLLEQLDIPNYLKYVEGKLLEEEKLCKGNYFYVSGLMEVLNKQLLEVHACVIVKDFTVFMDEERFHGDLKRMYCLLSRAKLVGYMDRSLRSYIQEKGAREGSLGEEFLLSTGKIWRYCFHGSRLLDKSIKESFAAFGVKVSGAYWEDKCSM